MAKCNACGRFISPSIDVARCGKCTAVFHRQCVGFNETSKIPSSWCCPSCKPKRPKGDNTPVKANHSEGSGDDDPSPLIISDAKSSPAALVSSASVSDNSGLLLEQFKEVREELRALRQEIQYYRNEVAELKSTVTVHATRLDNVETRLDTFESRFQEILPSSVKELEATVSHLRHELNERDQLTLANDVEVSNLPEEVGENSPHLAILIGAKLGVTLDDRDIIYAERVGQKRESSTVVQGQDPVAIAMRPRPRTLVIRFARRALRDDLLRAARVRRTITSADLATAGEPRRFYVNERLSKHNRQVFYAAKQLAREHNWKFVWTKSGHTFVRQLQGKAAYRVSNLENLKQIFGID